MICVMILRQRTTTRSCSSAASVVYQRQTVAVACCCAAAAVRAGQAGAAAVFATVLAMLRPGCWFATGRYCAGAALGMGLAIIYISEPTRPY